jgi:hypothetical protein
VPDFADAAKAKQHHKEGGPLRTETVINDPGDFGIGKGLETSRTAEGGI